MKYWRSPEGGGPVEIVEDPAAGFDIRDGGDGVDWEAVKADLGVDDFDNGRTPEELERSFKSSYASVTAWYGSEVVGQARILADGVCNAYLVDVWTKSSYRRRGIGSRMVSRLLERVPGHHIILQTDDAQSFYRRLGFRTREGAMDLIVGSWLNRG